MGDLINNAEALARGGDASAYHLDRVYHGETSGRQSLEESERSEHQLIERDLLWLASAIIAVSILGARRWVRLGRAATGRNRKVLCIEAVDGNREVTGSPGLCFQCERLRPKKGPKPLCLNEAGLAEGVESLALGIGFAIAHDNVVQEADVHDARGFAQLARDLNVGRAGRRVATGVIVDDDD